MESRGNGQQKADEKIKKIKASKIISSIVRIRFDKALSYSILTLNTRERNFKEIQPDIFPTIFKETSAMLETKKSMK